MIKNVTPGTPLTPGVAWVSSVTSVRREAPAARTQVQAPPLTIYRLTCVPVQFYLDVFPLLSCQNAVTCAASALASATVAGEVGLEPTGDGFGDRCSGR